MTLGAPALDEAFDVTRSLRHVRSVRRGTTGGGGVSLELVHAGKVRELYDAGPDQLRHGGLGPDLGLRRDPGRTHPRQGPGAHGHDRLLAGAAGRRGPQPPGVGRPGRPAPRGGRSWAAPPAWPGSPGGPCSCAGPRCCRSSASSAATWSVRAGPSTRRPGTLHGMALPAGLRQAERLPEPLFTPSTKATEGHDENISYEQAVDLVGKETAEEARDICVEAYRRAADAAEQHGIIVADTKFELGLIDGTPGPVRRGAHPRLLAFLAGRPVGSRAPTRPSFDKQPVRDWLAATGWDKTPPPPALPPEVVRGDERALRHRLRAHQRAGSGRLVRSRRRRGCREIRASGSRCGCGPGSPIRRGPPSSGPCPPSVSTASSGVRVGKAIRFTVEAADEDGRPGPGRGDVPSACWPTPSSRTPTSSVAAGSGAA